MANDPAAPTSFSRSADTIIDIASTNLPSCTASSENREGTGKNPNPNPILGSSCSLKRKRPPKIEIPNVLREIVVDKELSLRECAPQENAVCSSGYGFGVFSLKGKKKFMEDAHKIVTCSFEKKGFFGVYDGHGGSKAAEFVAENLHSNIYGMLKNSSGNAPKEEYIKAGYLKTDEDFLKQGLGSGVCCVTALIEGKDIVVSNLGDCRAVLCRGGAAEALTKDHKAGLVDERRRIEDKGGFVQHHRGAWRVHGILAVSRSIGDAHLKDWVPAEPDTKIISLTKDMEYLVLASDGLWEEVGNQEAADIVARSCSGEERIISKERTDECGRINLSPSPKLHRVSLNSKGTGQFSSSKRTIENWNAIESNFSSENDSPPSKAQRISKESNDECGRINLSPPSKLHRVSLKSKGTGQSSTSKRTIENWNASEANFSSENDSPLSKAQQISKESTDEYGRINLSPSPKLHRVSLKSKGTGQFPSSKRTVKNWNASEANFSSENDSPPSKAQRISILSQANVKSRYPNHENSILETKPACSGLVAACKELVNLAVMRGSLDDITVMVIDLNLFRN